MPNIDYTNPDCTDLMQRTPPPETDKTVLYARIHHIEIYRDLIEKLIKLGTPPTDENTQNLLSGWIEELWGKAGYENPKEMLKVTLEVLNQILSCAPEVFIVPVAGFNDELCRRSCRQNTGNTCEMGGIKIPHWLIEKADKRIAERSGIELNREYDITELALIIDKVKWATRKTLGEILVLHPREVIKPIMLEIKENITMWFKMRKEKKRRKKEKKLIEKNNK